jgi:hypothetical protein
LLPIPGVSSQLPVPFPDGAKEDSAMNNFLLWTMPIIAHYGHLGEPVKTQIWIAVSVYVLVAASLQNIAACPLGDSIRKNADPGSVSSKTDQIGPVTDAN